MEGNSTNSSNHESNIPTLDDNVTHSSKQLSIAMNDVAQWFEAFPQGSIIGWEELMSELLVKLKPPQRTVKPEAGVQPFAQEKEIEGIRAIMAQSEQIHQQLKQQLELINRKIEELQHAVANAQNSPQNPHCWNQPENGFGVINHEQQSYEQLQSPSNHSSMLQHRPQNDVYNPPWRTHSNLRWGEHQNQGQRDFNSGSLSNTNNYNHSSNNTNQFKNSQNTYHQPYNNSQNHQNNFSTPHNQPQIPQDT